MHCCFTSTRGDSLSIATSARNPGSPTHCLSTKCYRLGAYIFLGRFCSKWGSLQDEYYARLAHSIETKRQTGQHWQITVIISVRQQWFLLWALQNKALHGANARSQAQLERRVVKRTLIDLYNICHQMEPSVQQLVLHRNLTDHFFKIVAHSKNWLAVHGPLFRQSSKRASKSQSNSRGQVDPTSTSEGRFC